MSTSFWNLFLFQNSNCQTTGPIPSHGDPSSSSLNPRSYISCSKTGSLRDEDLFTGMRGGWMKHVMFIYAQLYPTDFLKELKTHTRFENNLIFKYSPSGVHLGTVGLLRMCTNAWWPMNLDKSYLGAWWTGPCNGQRRLPLPPWSYLCMGGAIVLFHQFENRTKNGRIDLDVLHRLVNEDIQLLRQFWTPCPHQMTPTPQPFPNGFCVVHVIAKLSMAHPGDCSTGKFGDSGSWPHATARAAGRPRHVKSANQSLRPKISHLAGSSCGAGWMGHERRSCVPG